MKTCFRPGGYDAMLTEGGMNLVAVNAKGLKLPALTLRPSILILDEATSALDTVVEEAIDQTCAAAGAPA